MGFGQLLALRWREYGNGVGELGYGLEWGETEMVWDVDVHVRFQLAWI
jgi:hypothetical protein